MRNGWVEVLMARHLARDFPWRPKLQRLLGAGMLTLCGAWHGDAANDPPIR